MLPFFEPIDEGLTPAELFDLAINPRQSSGKRVNALSRLGATEKSIDLQRDAFWVLIGDRDSNVRSFCYSAIAIMYSNNKEGYFVHTGTNDYSRLLEALRSESQSNCQRQAFKARVMARDPSVYSDIQLKLRSDSIKHRSFWNHLSQTCVTTGIDFPEARCDGSSSVGWVSCFERNPATGIDVRE